MGRGTWLASSILRAQSSCTCIDPIQLPQSGHFQVVDMISPSTPSTPSTIRDREIFTLSLPIARKPDFDPIRVADGRLRESRFDRFRHFDERLMLLRKFASA